MKIVNGRSLSDKIQLRYNFDSIAFSYELKFLTKARKQPATTNRSAAWKEEEMSNFKSQ